MLEEELSPPDLKETLTILRRLDGTVFAGQLAIMYPAPGCKCENCPCHSRSGPNPGDCACVPNCYCQGFTAIESGPLETPLDAPLGLATVLPIEDIKTLVGIREKLVKLRKKRGEK